MMLRIIVAAIICAIASPASTQEYPSRPVTVVVPSAAGSLSDILARLVIEKAAPTLGGKLIVDNRPGASGAIGSAFVARAQPDGYTILLANGASHGAFPALNKKTAYDPLKDFVPIARVGETQLALVASKKLPVSNAKELLAYAKEHAGKLTYATFGHGSAGHLFGEVMKKKNGIDMVHVPYKGEALAVQALMAGEVDLAMIVSAKPYVDKENVRLLGGTSPQGSAAYPGWPTLASQGVEGFSQARGFQAFVAPAGTPDSIVQKLRQALSQAVNHPDVKSRLLQLGVDPAAEPADQFPELYRDLVEQWRAIAAESGVTLD
jgi:tripartite-type tricarboxylate transporter receptor subunit TctC